ncbi:MAG TPA: SRPBCC domain-containing protein [Thermoanaerobaculia bacterium]|jgi:uncharacterized protein YndB with AHSA1/START domain|nr:SRPBCC domain-containing protein [Thermoanaerobaculia bacterium]
MSARIAALAVCLALSGSASAAVADAAPAGFTVKHQATLAAPPERVYRALTAEVGKWWDGAHTYSGDAANLSIDSKAGGCFCEKLENGGSIEHMRVVLAWPKQLFRMTGGLGPLQETGSAGSLTFKLAPAPTGTNLEMTYVVGGYRQGGFEKLAPLVDSVLGVQFARFRSWVETGSPTPAK